MKKDSKILIGIIVLSVVVIGGILFFIYNKQKPSNSNNTNTETTNNTNNESQQVTEEFEEFKNEAYGLSLKYSKELKKTFGSSELNLEDPKVAGSQFFCNIPDTPNLEFNKEIEVAKYIDNRSKYGKGELIRQEETTISKESPISCTLLEYKTGEFTDYIYLIPHRAGMICVGITFPTGEPIQSLSDIVDSIKIES